MLRIGDLVEGKYKILSKIGEGGMSIVYMAVNEKANKTWAIKEMKNGNALNYIAARNALMVEINLLKQLSHPNLPSIVDVIESGNSFLIVMDYLEGKPLSAALAEHGPQEQSRVIGWALQLCDVLIYLHSRVPPVIYRDMKPSNVMLKPDNTVVLFDFGIAREFKENQSEDTGWLGTKGYAAPEQYGGKGQSDARTDIYGLGATLYHLLTGHNPGEPPYKMYPIRYWNNTYSEGLEKIIMRCTRENPNERYQSAAQLWYDLSHYEELDSAFRRKEVRKLGWFFTSLVCSGLFLAASAYMQGKMVGIQNAGYEKYIAEAIAQEDVTEKFNLCKNAAAIKPYGEETYLELLSEFEKDGVFSEEEQRMFRELIGIAPGAGFSNLEYLKQENRQGYGKVCRQAALLYFYYVEGGTKSGAKEWFSEFLELDETEQSDRVRAQLLYRISDYYANLGTKTKAGDSMKSFAEYWEDLKQSIQEDIVAKDNVTTAMVVYREFLYQMIVNCAEFQNAGIEKKEMEKQVNKIRVRIQEDVRKKIEQEDQKSRMELYQAKESLEQNLEMAEKTIGLMFQKTKES